MPVNFRAPVAEVAGWRVLGVGVAVPIEFNLVSFASESRVTPNAGCNQNLKLHSTISPSD
jgi:hypothetical protein